MSLSKLKVIIAGLIRHSLLRNSVLVFSGSMLANFAAYLYHLLVGRMLGPSQYGELAAMLSLFSLLNVPSASLQIVLAKYFSKLKAKGEIGQIHWLFLKMTKIVFAIVVLLLFAVLPLLPAASRFLNIQNSIYFLWIYLIFASFVLSTVIGSLLQGLQLFKQSTILVNIGSMLRLGAGVAAAGFGVGWVLVSNIVTNILTYIFSFLPIRFVLRVKAIPVQESPKQVFNYSLVTFITTLGVTSLYSQDVVLVKHFFDAETAGIYSSLSVLGRIIFFATSAVGFVVFPVLSEYVAKKKSYTRLITLALGMVAIVSSGITFMYFIWPELFITLLYGSSYILASKYLGLFGIFISLFSLSNLLVTMCLALKRTFVWFLVSAAALTQILVLNGFHQDLGAVITGNIVVASSLLIALLVYFAYAKHES